MKVVGPRERGDFSRRRETLGRRRPGKRNGRSFPGKTARFPAEREGFEPSVLLGTLDLADVPAQSHLRPNLMPFVSGTTMANCLRTRFLRPPCRRPGFPAAVQP